MSARVVIDVRSGLVEVTVRGPVGVCTCGAADDVHDAGCAVLTPAATDLAISEPARSRKPYWWRRWWR